jgi:NADPH-dependent 2,4-dienoyl-CoA reductase/sulfur reductase-like enzyme
MTDPFVVVGGDAAGLSAASKCRREDPDREVVVFEKGRWVSYAHCGTPYYVKGSVPRLTDLLSLSPDDVEKRGIDLRREHEVVGVDADARTVTVDGPDGEFEQSYGDLLIATGARAVRGDIDGVEKDGVFTLHGLDDAAAIRAFLEPAGTYGPDHADDGRNLVDADRVAAYAGREPPRTVAIVGGGYVGVEMAEAFRMQGTEVHLFQRPSTPLQGFGDAVGATVAEELDENDVRVYTETSVVGFDGDGVVESVEYVDTKDAGDPAAEPERLDIDAALVGVGIAPNTHLAEDAGASLGDSGAVAVDDYGRTDVEGIYAAGDCAESTHAVTGEPSWDPLGLPANRAGRAIGATVAGDETPVGEVVGTAVVKAFDLGCGRAGFVSVDAARDAGFDPVSETITAGSRSGYYPGNEELTVTLVADRESGRLLGGSTVGKDRAAKRIDTVATALQSGLTVGEFERLDLAYAPPFSPVWDPLLVCAKVLNGKLDS